MRARVLAYAGCGVDPKLMGIGPVPAVRKVLERSGRRLEEIEVIELNEAFAAQALAVIDDLGLDEEIELGLVTLCVGGGQGIAMLLGRE